MFCPQVGTFVDPVAFTFNKGAHPVRVLRLNAAVGKGFTQMVRVMVSNPHRVVPVIIFMVYVPGVLKVTCTISVPEVHASGLLGKLLFEPRDPEPIVHPAAGVISQIVFPLVQAPLPALGTVEPTVLVFVNVILLPTQVVSFGEMVKSASAFLEIRIPPMVPGVSPQGFTIL